MEQCNELCSTVRAAYLAWQKKKKKKALNITRKFLNHFFFTPAMLIGTVDFYILRHFH